MTERDYGLEAQRAAEEHLERLYEADEMDEYPEDYPALAPFCGCTTCIVREVLYVGWPILEEAVLAEERARVQQIIDDAVTPPGGGHGVFGW